MCTLGKTGVNTAVLQESKLTGGIYTHSLSGYLIVVTNAPSRSLGKVALCWREGEHFEVEGTKIQGPNMLTY